MARRSARRIIKIKDRSVPLLYLIVIVPLLLAIVAQFGLIDLTGFTVPFITILAALFVMSEVTVMGFLRGRALPKDFVRMFGAIVAIVAIIFATMTLFNLSLGGMFAPLAGIVNVLLIIYVLIEGFR